MKVNLFLNKNISLRPKQALKHNYKVNKTENNNFIYPSFLGYVNQNPMDKYLGDTYSRMLFDDTNDIGTWNKIEILDKINQLLAFELIRKEDLEKYDLENKLNSIRASFDNSIYNIDTKSTAFIDELDNLKDFDFIKYSKNGLPLKYSRKEFLSDLSSEIKNLSNDEKYDLFKKMDINPIFKNEEITGYDGLINLENLDKSSKVFEITNNFINNNEVMTDDENVNKSLNSLISNMSEFVNTISKKQQDEHPYSLDIHTLSALQDILNDERYQELSPVNKKILKFSILLHDISKREDTKDFTHPLNSARLSKNIIEKYDLSNEEKENIIKLVKNHYWLNDFAHFTIKPEDVANIFNTKDLWKMAQILTYADMKAGNIQLFYRHIPSMDEARLKPINDLVNNT